MRPRMLRLVSRSSAQWPAAHSQTHAPRKCSDPHFSPAGQLPKHAGNRPPHESNVVLVVVLLVVAVVDVGGGRVVVVARCVVVVVGGRVVVAVVDVGGGVVVVTGAVVVVGGPVVVVVEVVVVDVGPPGQTKMRPLSCSRVATAASPRATCAVRSRQGGHLTRTVTFRALPT